MKTTNYGFRIFSQSYAPIAPANAYADTPEEAQANAHLIAAAPDLLQACLCALADLEGLREEGVFYWDDENDEEEKPPQIETIEELEKAIAKATS